MEEGGRMEGWDGGWYGGRDGGWDGGWEGGWKGDSLLGIAVRPFDNVSEIKKKTNYTILLRIKNTG